jgi:hypothetical protein
MRQDLLKDYSGISSEALRETRGEKMVRKNIVNLLEIYEHRDFFYERARNWENSPLSIKDELIA